MNQITKKQHFVPKFYLKSWQAPGKDSIWSYDLQHKSIKDRSPTSVLFEDYYYEHDREFPDNIVENLLSEMENETAPVIREINEIVQRYSRLSQENELQRDLRHVLKPDKRRILKKFAAYQYLRIPDAIEQKAYELRPENIAEGFLSEMLKPANFVLSGFDYIKNKFFQELRMVISYSLNYDFVTSDRPCFDFDDSRYTPRLGVDIGQNSGAFLIFPLVPKILLTLFARAMIPGDIIPPEPVITSISDGNVKNTNTLIIQQAKRCVIYNRREDFILKVARKRPREFRDQQRG